MPATARPISPDSPRKKIKDRRRLQLIDAAMESIARHGLSETTISHISEAAGMSRGIVNFYFKTKEEMLRETLAQLLQEQAATWQEALEKAAGKAPGERLAAIVSSLFSPRLSSRKKLTVWAAFVAHAATHPAYRYLFEVEIGRLREAVVLLTGEVDPAADAAAFANGLISYIRGFRLELLIGGTERTRQALEREALAFLQHLEPNPATSSNVNELRVPPSVRKKSPEPALTATSDLFGEESFPLPKRA